MELSWRNPPGWAGAALRGLRTSLRAAASPRGSLSPGRAEPALPPETDPALPSSLLVPHRTGNSAGSDQFRLFLPPLPAHGGAAISAHPIGDILQKT